EPHAGSAICEPRVRRASARGFPPIFPVLAVFPKRIRPIWCPAADVIMMFPLACSEVSIMRFRPAAFGVLAATVPFWPSAFAHHSQAMFDQSQEILIEGTVARFDWKNPHMYLIVETIGPDGKPALVEGEGLAITQALVDGLRREALEPGTPVVMR